MKLGALLSGFLFVFFCATGLAQKPGNKKQVVQQKKIVQGVKTGELTKKEAAQLRHQQKNIAHTRKVAKSDGVVTPKEKAIIHQKQKRADKNIAKKKHNTIKVD